jgi:esterase/lipase
MTLSLTRTCPIIGIIAWLALAHLVLAGPASAAGRLGIVLMHGEQGSPRSGIDGLAAALEKAGHLVSRPDMCWSARRGNEARFEECLAALDTAIVRLKNLGASGIVVGGLGLGGTAAIVYGAEHAGLQGIIALAPGHDARAMAANPDIAAGVAKASALVAQGKGDDEESFTDIGIDASGSYATEVATTANIYLSFFGPASKAVIAGNIERIAAPLLLVTASEDPEEGEAASVFARAPPRPLTRHLAVAGGRFVTPEAAQEAVKSWLEELGR